MKNIHPQKTDKPSRLTLLNNERLLFSKEDCELSKTKRCVNQNIYITNSEEIKEGDWFIRKNKIHQLRWDDGNSNLYTKNGLKIYKSSSKKIILTTDQDLIKDGVQAIEDEFLEWFVQNPSCEFVEVELIPNSSCLNCEWDHDMCPNSEECLKNTYKIIIPKEEMINCEHCGGDGIYITADSERVECPMCEKGKIPKEEPNKTYYLDELPNMDREVLAKMWESAMPKLKPKQETLEEAAECKSHHSEEDFIRGAKWQQERSYSELELFINEVKDKIDSFEYSVNQKSYISEYLDEWFEQFKK
jgi:hypothetical protein